MTDIVMMTCDRLPMLKRTLAYIQERTRTPYRLQAIDDASTEGNAEYLLSLHLEGRIDNLLVRERRAGIAANLGAILDLTASDPVVFTDDDVLCPRLMPDWLDLGLDAMAKYPQLGLLALNNPQCNVGDKRRRGEVVGKVTLCRNIGGTFAFVRRAVLRDCQPPDDVLSPVKDMCYRAAAIGWRIGYLTDVYCQHIGSVSVRSQLSMAEELKLTAPVDGDTLEPTDAYKD